MHWHPLFFAVIKPAQIANNMLMQINERSIPMSCIHRIIFTLLALLLVTTLALLVLALTTRLNISVFTGGILS